MNYAGSSSVILYEHAKSELAIVDSIQAQDLVGISPDELDRHWRRWAIQQSINRQVPGGGKVQFVSQTSDS